LVLRYLIGNSGGCIFPSYDEIRRIIDPATSDKYSYVAEHYNSYKKGIESTSKSITCRIGASFGAQSGRKSFYLYGILAGASLEELMDNARHATIASARLYWNDASESYILIIRILDGSGEIDSWIIKYQPYRPAVQAYFAE
jgi:hypothetical protein